MGQPGWEGSLGENGYMDTYGLSPFTVHWKLSQYCLSTVPQQKTKKKRKWCQRGLCLACPHVNLDSETLQKGPWWASPSAGLPWIQRCPQRRGAFSSAVLPTPQPLGVAPGVQVPGCRWQRVRETELTSVVSVLTRALIPFMGPPPSWPNHFPKVPPPIMITLGIRLQHLNTGDANTQPIAITKQKFSWSANTYSNLLPPPPTPTQIQWKAQYFFQI